MRARCSGVARIALVGSSTHDGNRLREALAAIGVPGGRVDLYGAGEGEALIVAEGFTTATAGNGTWGSFEETVSFEAETAGVGAVIVWEESAEDGSQINVVEYPVDVGAAS